MKRLLSLIIISLYVMPLVSGADIVWSGEQNISLGLGPGEYFYSLDINDDDSVDFIFRNYEIEMFFVPVVGNAGLSVLGNNYDPITVGVSVGPVMPSFYSWRDDERLLVGLSLVDSGSEESYFRGPFSNTNAFLGASFQVADVTHYGWIHLVHDNEGVEPLSLTIQDWAWETEADTAILAGAIPEPSSVLLVLLGAFTVWVVNIRKYRRPCR